MRSIQSAVQEGEEISDLAVGHQVSSRRHSPHPATPEPPRTSPPRLRFHAGKNAGKDARFLCRTWSDQEQEQNSPAHSVPLLCSRDSRMRTGAGAGLTPAFSFLVRLEKQRDRTSGLAATHGPILAT